jgi:hypothetical protein
MNSRNALHELDRLLGARELSVDKLSVSDGIDAMLDFYRSTRADDCSLDADGDMLLFQWGTYDWGQGERFELDLTRQLTPNGGEDEDIWQLSLTFMFPPNAIVAGDRWCATPADLAEFARFVRSHAAYAAAVQATPVRIELDFESAG